MYNDLDHCPACDLTITDHDPDGMEAADGQRWCVEHYPMARELTGELIYLQMGEHETVARWVVGVGLAGGVLAMWVAIIAATTALLRWVW